MIAVRVQTTGWIGLGFSPNGQMPGSDVVIGWVDNTGKRFLQDRFAFTRTTPQYDASQDWKLTGAGEEGGYTTLQFERKFETCDDEDIALSFGDTVHLIYSYHTEDPINNEQILQHQFQGSITINLFGQQDNVPTLPPDIKHIDVINYNISVPAKDTTYLCTVMEVPSKFQNQTHYVVKTAAQISSQSARHVHHILLYLCEGVDLTGDPSVGVSMECDGISERIQPCRFSNVIAGWAVGGNDFIFPENAALPIGGTDKIHTHYLLEMHYDNPDEVSGIVDSSGIRLYYTDKPRQEDAAVLTLGHSVIGHMIIPPRVQQYVVHGFCSSNCTDEYFPEDGITVFANLLHLHTVGVELTLKHIRNGTELKPIDINRNYDFNFQQTNYIPKVKVLPGDQMILECVYNTQNRNTTTFGGEGTRDEMCLSFLYYYPATDLSGCVSFVNPPAYDEWLHTYVPSDQHFVIEAAANDSVSDVRPVFDSLDWSEQNYRMFEHIGQTEEHVHICVLSTDENFKIIVNKPSMIEEPFKNPELCTSDADRSGSISILNSSYSLMVLIFCLLAVTI
ncbi:putative DBH-like monooxygenase protein 2 isoform X2 [Dysidea avara]